MRHLLLVALALSLLSFSTSSTGKNPALAQQDKGETELAQVSDEMWADFTNAIRKDYDLKHLSRFKKADFEPLLPEWSKASGRELELVEESFLKVVDRAGYFGERGARFDLEFRDGAYILRSGVDTRSRMDWSLSTEQLASLDYECLSAVVVPDPFEVKVRAVPLSGQAGSIVETICGQVGCGYVVPVGGPNISVSVRPETRTARELLDFVTTCAGWKLDYRRNVGREVISTKRVIDHARKENADLGVAPTALYAEWILSGWLTRTDGCTVVVSVAR